MPLIHDLSVYRIVKKQAVLPTVNISAVAVNFKNPLPFDVLLAQAKFHTFKEHSHFKKQLDFLSVFKN